jgi:hypothetical protein
MGEKGHAKPIELKATTDTCIVVTRKQRDDILPTAVKT